MTNTYLSTSRPFLLFATMSNKKGFSSGLPRQRSFRKLWTEKRSKTYIREGSPAMNALMHCWSFIGIGMVKHHLRTSSCLNSLSFLSNETKEREISKVPFEREEDHFEALTKSSCRSRSLPKHNAS